MEKRYGLPTAICLVVGIVIGSGIFFKTESVLNVTDGNVLTGVLAIALVGLIAFFCVYAFSILAQKYEKVNGLVDYAEATCGSKYAYYLGWYMTFIYTPGITSVLGWVTARYLCQLFGFGITSGETLAVAGLILVSVAFINGVAPKLAGKLQVSTTVIKLIPLCLMAVVGIIAGLSNGQLAQNFQMNATSSVSFMGGLSASVVALAFAFEGWILATTINAELKNSKKNLPLALIFGIIVIVAIYIFYYLGICGAITKEELMVAGSTQAFKNLFGNGFGTLLSVFIVVSCLGTTNGLVMANSRNLYSIAARGHGPNPKLFGKVDEASNMPMNSTFFGALISMVWMVYFFGANLSEKNWFGLFSFDSSELVIVALYAFYIPIFVMMFKDKELGFGKRVIVPALAIISCVALVVCAVFAHGIMKYQAAAANGEFSFPVLFFLIVTAIVMFIGKFFYREEKEETK